ncbi:MAG: DUF2917 domain-containing protein [Rhizobacter sp.]|nr:DUF2917 domain-containing protein [Rhizobacter sp.]
MNSLLMPQKQHSSAALWALDGGEAMRLEIGPGVRELHVTEGRLWLTRKGTERAPAEDIWLTADDTLALESGSQWVAEGWGDTRFQLLVPPQACGRNVSRPMESARSRAAPAAALIAA